MKELKEIFEKYEIKLSEIQIQQFEEYFSLLIETNKVLNLTAITEEHDVIIKHFLDSVLPANNFPQNAKIIDVGSGAGFPSIPLKILRTDLNVCMIDSLNKRINFLQTVIEELNLKDIKAEHYRAEDYAKKNRETFDVATARAVAPLNTLVEYLLPFVKIGGYAVIYKSTKLQEELKEAEKAIKILGGDIEKIDKYIIDEDNIERDVLIIKKISHTPIKYPRDKNKPKIQPIK